MCTKQNSAHGFVRGIELGAARRWRNGLGVSSNLTWLESELETTVIGGATRTVTGPLSRTMPLTMNFGLDWTPAHDRYRAALDVMIVARADKLSADDRADAQRIPPGGTPGYEFVRLSFGKRFGTAFDLALGVTNIFDVTYRTHGSGVNEAGVGADVRLTARF